VVVTKRLLDEGENAIGEDVVGVNNSENLGLGDCCGQQVRWLANVGFGVESIFFISEQAAINN
jgi:hypothetical protein